MLNFVNNHKQTLISCENNTKEMIDETNGMEVYPSFDSYLHDASNKIYMDDMDNDMDVLNRELFFTLFPFA